MPGWIVAIGDKVLKWLGGILKNKILKALIRMIDEKFMPQLEAKAFRLGVAFSQNLRKLAAKKKLKVDKAETVEEYIEQLNVAFWRGANADDKIGT